MKTTKELRKITDRLSLLAKEMIPSGHDWAEWTRAKTAREEHEACHTKLFSLD